MKIKKRINDNNIYNIYMWCASLRQLSKTVASDLTSTEHRLDLATFKLGYCKELFLIENIMALKDKKLWDKITDSNLTTALDDLLPLKRTIFGYIT